MIQEEKTQNDEGSSWCVEGLRTQTAKVVGVVDSAAKSSFESVSPLRI